MTSKYKSNFQDENHGKGRFSMIDHLLKMILSPDSWQNSVKYDYFGVSILNFSR